MAFQSSAAPMLDPIANVTLPAGKTLFVPVTATSTNGAPITYTVTTSTSRITPTVLTGNPWLKISVSNFGDMTFQLLRHLPTEDVAPHTVANISGLVDAGFYDGLTFHRVITNFVIQGGDPLGNGTGGPNFRFDDEFHRYALFTGNGQLAMANSGKDSNGSQIFVTRGPQRHLDLNYPIFGQLVRGFNVLTNINTVPTDTNDAPVIPVVITRAQIVSNITDTVLLLQASTTPATAIIKVVANDGQRSVTNSFQAQSLADTVNDPPILNPVQSKTSPSNTTAQINLSAIDLEGNTLAYYAEFLSAPTNVMGSISANVVKVTPPKGFVGPIRLLVGVQRDSFFNPLDSQEVVLGIGDKALMAKTNWLSGFAGYSFSNVTVATFTDADTVSRPTNFTATINWGDNVVITNSSTSVATNAGGGYKVTNSHTYIAAGEYPVTVTINDYLGATATAFSRASILAVPVLNISRLTNLFLLSWPVTPTNFSLQVSTDLAPAANWLAVTNAPGITNGEKRLTVPATNASRFYRLRRP